MDEGDILDPYDGHVKSIFLPDDQQPLSRMGGVQKLENSLIGRVNTLGSYKPKISLKTKGFRTSLSEEFVQLTKSLQREREKNWRASASVPQARKRSNMEPPCPAMQPTRK